MGVVLQIGGAVLPRVYWVIFVLLELGAIAVFWCFDAQPFMDFPGHAGVMALRQRYWGSLVLQRDYVVTLNLGGYPLYRLVSDGLAGLIGPVATMRAISTFPVVALPLAMHYARRRLYQDDSALFLFVTLVLSFGYMTQMGLTPFLVAFPVVIWALTDWLIYLEKCSTGPVALRREAGVAALVLMVGVMHAYAFAVLSVIMLMTAASRRPLWRYLICLRVLAPALFFVLFTAWLAKSTNLPPQAVAQVVPFGAIYGSLLDKLGLLITPFLATRTGIDAAIGVAIWAAAVTGMVATLRRKSSSIAVPLRNACIALMVGFAVLPHRVRSFDFVDSRLLPIILLAAFMAIDGKAITPRWRRHTTMAAATAATTVVGLQLFAMQTFQGEAAGFHAVVGQMPAGRRMLYLPVQADSRIFISHPFVHYDKLAFVERGVLPSQFHFHHASGIFPTRNNPILRLPHDYVESDLKSIAWPHYDLAEWDFVMIRTFPDAPAPAVPEALALMDHRGGWWLYRSAAAAGELAAQPRRMDPKG